MAAPTVRGSTAAVAGLSTTSPSATAIGDLVICYTFERLGVGSASTLTTITASGFVEIINRFHNDASTDGAHAVAYKIATAAGAQTYTPFSSTVGTETWTGCLVLTAGTYDVSTLPPSVGSSQTNNAVPDPPDLTGLSAARDYLGIAISAWHLGSAATVTVTVPSGFDARGDIAGSATAELACATDEFTGVTNINPGAWGDDVAPNGTSSITIAVGNVLPVSLTPGVATLTAAGVAALTFLQEFLTPAVATLTAAGLAATLGTAVIPTPGAATLTGHAPTVEVGAPVENTNITPPTGELWFGIVPPIERTPPAATLTATGAAPTLAGTVHPTPGTLTLTGAAPTLGEDVRPTPPAGTLTLEGAAPSLLAALQATPPAGTLTLEGLAPLALATVAETPPAGTLTLEGLAPTAAVSDLVSFTPPAATLTLAGLAPTLAVSDLVSLTPPAGTLALEGAAATLGHGLIPTPGAFVLAGAEPTVIESTPGNTSLVPPAATLTLTGLAPTAQADLFQTPPAGTLTLEGLAPTVETQATITLTPGAGSLAVTGEAPALQQALQATPGAGTLTVEGLAPGVAHPQQATPPAGALGFTGRAPGVANSGVVITLAMREGSLAFHRYARMRGRSR